VQVLAVSQQYQQRHWCDKKHYVLTILIGAANRTSPRSDPQTEQGNSAIGADAQGRADAGAAAILLQA
jgi:hypothetical protein